MGIRTSKLTEETAPEQLSIFDIEMPKEPDEKHKKLNRALDELNERFGAGAVVKASRLPKKQTPGQQESASQKREGTVDEREKL